MNNDTMRNLLRYKTLILGILSVFLLTCVFVFSCTKTATVLNPNTSINQDKQIISTNVDNTALCITDIVNGNGFHNTVTFLKLINKIQGNNELLNAMASSLEHVMPKSSKADSSFDFKSYCGNYEWNPIKSVFTKTSANTIIISFPSDSSAASNNVTASFDSYTEKTILIDGKNVTLPVTAKLTIIKNGIKIATINYLRSFEADNTKTKSISLALNYAPFSYSIKINEINPTQYSVVADLGCSSVLNATLTLNNSMSKNFNANSDLNKIDFNYTKDNFIVKGTWNALSYYKIVNPTSNSINTTFACTLNNTTSKIGDLKFIDENGVRKLALYFKDGSPSDIRFDYNPFLTEIKLILAPFFGKDIMNWF